MLVGGTAVEKKNSDGTIEKTVIPPTVRGWGDPRPYTLGGVRLQNRQIESELKVRQKERVPS